MLTGQRFGEPRQWLRDDETSGNGLGPSSGKAAALAIAGAVEASGDDLASGDIQSVRSFPRYCLTLPATEARMRGRKCARGFSGGPLGSSAGGADRPVGQSPATPRI